MSLVLGEGSEKRGRWSDIAGKNCGEEERGKEDGVTKGGSGMILFGILPEE